MHFGNGVKKALIDKGMRQNDLHEKMQIGKPTISKWCNSESVSTQTAARIAEALGMKVSDLIALGE